MFCHVLIWLRVVLRGRRSLSLQNQTEDGMRKELVSLQEDKHHYEITAKESLRRVLQEKIEVARKLSEVERSLRNTEDECSHLKEMKERNHEELRELAHKYNGAVKEIKDLTEKIKVVCHLAFFLASYLLASFSPILEKVQGHSPL
uniref:Uncharacterized protein n=1 Tax=Hucho hucho TaxID=62062 RepID=A0A4W5K5A7_9TELE